ncbi:MAG: ATP-binding cassette domain-containing protein, partial [Planifilum fulgidum]
MEQVPGGTRLEITGLQKRFGERPVLKGVDLQVNAGEFVAIVGRSGCGKSTLLRLIAGLETPTDGRIALDGAPVRGINTAVRVMFQEPRLLPWQKVADNVALGIDGDQDKEKRTAEALN